MGWLEILPPEPGKEVRETYIVYESLEQAFNRIRAGEYPRRFVGEGFWGKLLDCFYCLSVWIAAPIAYLIGQSWLERALLWPSLAAAAILLERVTNPEPRVPPAPFVEGRGEEQDDASALPDFVSQ